MEGLENVGDRLSRVEARMVRGFEKTEARIGHVEARIGDVEALVAAGALKYGNIPPGCLLTAEEVADHDMASPAFPHKMDWKFFLVIHGFPANDDQFLRYPTGAVAAFARDIWNAPLREEDLYCVSETAPQSGCSSD